MEGHENTTFTHIAETLPSLERGRSFEAGISVKADTPRALSSRASGRFADASPKDKIRINFDMLRAEKGDPRPFWKAALVAGGTFVALLIFFAVRKLTLGF